MMVPENGWMMVSVDDFDRVLHYDELVRGTVQATSENFYHFGKWVQSSFHQGDVVYFTGRSSKEMTGSTWLLVHESDIVASEIPD